LKRNELCFGEVQKSSEECEKKGNRVWRVGNRDCEEQAPYTLRGDGKSAEVIERKADMRRPLRKRVRKSLKGKGLNKRDGKEYKAMERGLRMKSGMEFGKHGQM
jgi:hypothetical protein